MKDDNSLSVSVTLILENTNIKLRALENSDLELLYKWENSTPLWTLGNTLSPYSKQVLRQYINESQLYDIYHNRQLRLMIVQKSDEQAVGTIDMYDFDIRNQKAGIGIFVEEHYRNKHFALDSLMLIKEYAFSFLHLHQLYAHILVNNTPSIRLFEKAGYEKAGVMKDWVRRPNGYEDALLLQLINSDQ